MLRPCNQMKKCHPYEIDFNLSLQFVILGTVGYHTVFGMAHIESKPHLNTT